MSNSTNTTALRMSNSTNTTTFAPSIWPSKSPQTHPQLATTESFSFYDIFSFKTLGSTLVVGVAIASAVIICICICFIFRSYVLQYLKRRAEASQQISEVFAVVSPRNPGDNSTPFSPEVSHAIPIRDRVIIRENAIELTDNVTIIESPRAKRRFSQNVTDLASPILTIPGRVKTTLRRQSSRDRDREDEIIMAFSPDEISGMCERFGSTSNRSLAIMPNHEFEPEIESKDDNALGPAWGMSSDSILTTHSNSVLPFASISEDFDEQLPIVPAIFSPLQLMPILPGCGQGALLSPVIESLHSTPNAPSSAQRRGSAPPSLSVLDNFQIIPEFVSSINTHRGYSPIIGPIQNLFPTSPTGPSTLQPECSSQSLIPITARRARSLPSTLFHFNDGPSLVSSDLQRSYAAMDPQSTFRVPSFRAFSFPHSSNFFLPAPEAGPITSETGRHSGSSRREEKSWTPGRFEHELQRGKAFLNSAQLFQGSHSTSHRSNLRSTSV